jgi:tRNA G26 N,N-dimethylase Trm1
VADKLINVTDSQDTEPKNIRLKAISGDADSAHAVSVDGLVSLSATDNAVLDSVVTQLQGMNMQSSVIFDSILITYQDATKAVITKVEWKLAAAVVKTLTPTFGSTTDSWVKS